MEFIEPSIFLPMIEPIFEQLDDQLRELFPTSRIEHIGSSSIPGLISKGDLDIFLGVNAAEFDEAVDRVASIGFYEKRGTLRTDSLRMMITDRYSEDVAIQVVANHSEFEFFIDFRDKMRSNSQWVSQYNALKRRCRGMTHSQYRDLKSAFIEAVLDAT
ncbi:MAG: GrpB-like predicted nucleotidyltransferase (UPF0157 family) [Paraglaciecola psychrophila]|jgi:GrpB-like predicted nucleotidyltransferase (UPF0157 family)